MTIDYGALEIPLPVPAALTTAGDPMLDYLGAFLQAAINADTKAAWAKIDAGVVPPWTEPVTVAFVHTRNPDESDFLSNELPSLFVYRGDRGVETGTQDWTISKTSVCVLWVPPLADIEKISTRRSFGKAIEAVVTRCLLTERHPAYIAPGDLDPVAAYRGSFVRQFTKWFKPPCVTSAKDHPLRLQRVDNPRDADTFDCFLVTFEIEECLHERLDEFDGFDHLESTVNSGGIPGVGFFFRPALASITPSGGPIAGGTAITIVGSELDDGTTFTLGGVACTNVVRVDDQTFTATTGAHAAGAVALLATLSSGETASLPLAFTYA